MSSMRSALRPLVLFGAIGLFQAASGQTSSSIASNFNGTAISGSDYIWFNAHITSLTFANEAALAPDVTVHVSESTVSFTNNGVNYVVNIPNSDLTYSTSAVSATGSFNNGAWEISFPKNSDGDSFIGGVMWDVPAAGLVGGTNPVTWTAKFSSDIGMISSLSWQWSAAVYTNAPSDPNQLAAQFQDGNGLQSGTPVSYESYVTGGARGGGGSNFTGSNSATGHLTNVVPEPSSAVLGLIGGLALLVRRRI